MACDNRLKYFPIVFPSRMLVFLPQSDQSLGRKIDKLKRAELDNAKSGVRASEATLRQE